MAAYAIAPVKGIADVLNEAADANEKGLDSDRKMALTVSQVRGEEQRQELARNADRRAEAVHGYAMDEASFQQDRRNRERKLGEFMGDSAKRHFTREMPRQTGAIPEVIANDDGTSTIRDPQTQTVTVDLAGPDGFKSILGYQRDVLMKRLELNLLSPEEFRQSVAFMETMEKSGRAKLFQAAVMGDRAAADTLGAQFGFEPGAVRITKGFDKNGNPDIFMESTKTGGGQTTTSKRSIGALAAMMSPEVYKAFVTDPMAMAKDRSTIDYQSKLGAAATVNAATNSTNAASLEGLREQQGNWYKTRAKAINEEPDKINTAAHKTSLYSSYTDGDGKNLILPSAATNKARIAAEAEALGMNRRDAARFADQEWARLASERKRWEDSARNDWEVANGKKSMNTFRTGLQFEDTGLTSATSKFLASKTENGLQGRAAAYMSRRQRALNDKDPGEDSPTAND